MRRISSRFSFPLLGFACLLALAFTLAFAGIAEAAPANPSQAALPSTSCISAAPATQFVVVNTPASVKVTVSCYPISSSQLPAVLATWGDGSTTLYPLCLPVCQMPPVVIHAVHTYTKIAVFRPTFCLTPPGPTPQCASVQITVLPQV